MLGILGRIAGPKVLLGVVITAALVIGWLWWSYSSAQAEASAQRSRAEQASAAAKANRVAANTWRRNAEALSKTISARQQRERSLRRDLANTQQRLEEARENASAEFQACLDRRLPSDFARELRYRDRDQGGGPDDQAAEGTDGSG